jgi:hypothetical protein
MILQSRPLKIQNPKNFCLLKAAPLPGYTMLVDGSEIASQGVGTGTVFHVPQLRISPDFPAGRSPDCPALFTGIRGGDAELQCHHGRGGQRQRPHGGALP